MREKKKKTIMIIKKTRLPERGTYIMVVTVRTVLVAFVIFGNIFTKRLFAFLTHEGHFSRACELVRLGLGVAFGAVIPAFAAGRANGHLSV
jgi:hypothetical protein